MEATLNAAHLRAASYFSGDKDIRYYLNGVFVEVRSSETRIVATNGEAAAVLREVTSIEQDVLPDVIIPNDTVKLALGLKSATLPLVHDKGAWTLGGIPFKPQGGVFPPYRRIIPTTCTGAPGQFQIDLLARFGKAAKALGCKSTPVIRHNGEGGGALVQLPGFEDAFVGVLMPIRIFNEKRPDPGLSTWGPRTAK